MPRVVLSLKVLIDSTNDKKQLIARYFDSLITSLCLTATNLISLWYDATNVFVCRLNKWFIDGFAPNIRR